MRRSYNPRCINGLQAGYLLTILLVATYPRAAWVGNYFFVLGRSRQVVVTEHIVKQLDDVPGYPAADREGMVDAYEASASNLPSVIRELTRFSATARNAVVVPPLPKPSRLGRILVCAGDPLHCFGFGLFEAVRARWGLWRPIDIAGWYECVAR